MNNNNVNLLKTTQKTYPVTRVAALCCLESAFNH